jgi:hypothetical protein
MPDDIEADASSAEHIDSSGENQNGGEEDNSLGEKKNQSNFKKLAKSNKQKDREIERLRAELAKRSTGKSDDGDDEDDSDFDDEDDTDSSEVLTGSDARFFFIENPEAKQYREEMEELLDDNPKRKALSLEDLYLLAKTRFPKSVSKKTFDVSSGSKTDVSKIDVSKMSAEEIDALPRDVYKRLFMNKK